MHKEPSWYIVPFVVKILCALGSYLMASGIG
jgi:hypothetical protein